MSIKKLIRESGSKIHTCSGELSENDNTVAA
jgi:hypothetical protein